MGRPAGADGDAGLGLGRGLTRVRLHWARSASRRAGPAVCRPVRSRRAQAAGRRLGIVTDTTTIPATFAIGDLTIHRLGFGSMQLTGPGVWGPPKDVDEAKRVLRRAVELGVDFIDTADSYGPYVAEELIARGAAPVPGRPRHRDEGRAGPHRARTSGRRSAGPSTCARRREMSLRRLELDAHRPVPAAPHRPEGAARGPGRRAEEAAGRGQDPPHRPVRGQRRRASTGRAEDRRRSSPCRTCTTWPTATPRPLLDYCRGERHRLHPVVPARDRRARQGRAARSTELAKEHDATPSQLALAWLLHRSPVMLPIPGTSSVAHLEDNMRAAELRARARRGRRARGRGLSPAARRSPGGFGHSGRETRPASSEAARFRRGSAGDPLGSDAVDEDPRQQPRHGTGEQGPDRCRRLKRPPGLGPGHRDHPVLRGHLDPLRHLRGEAPPPLDPLDDRGVQRAVEALRIRLRGQQVGTQQVRGRDRVRSRGPRRSAPTAC